MSAKHTPGPWEQDQSDEYAIMAECGSAIATVLTGADFPCLDDGEQLAIIPECEANARLIAAAPTLLEALEAFVAGADAGHVSVEVDNAARAAINAAKGQAFDPSRGCNILDNVHQICPRHGHSHAPTKTQPTGGHK